MSPRRFDRRTYMIVAPGWSTLAFKAAMSASSASTTIRSAFSFTLSPTVNCHDIFDLLKATVRTSANRYRPIPCVRTRSSCACGLSRRGALSAHPHMHKKTEWGGRWLRGITYYMVRPTRASYIGISQQWRASLTNGNSVTPAQVTSITAFDCVLWTGPDLAESIMASGYEVEGRLRPHPNVLVSTRLPNVTPAVGLRRLPAPCTRSAPKLPTRCRGPRITRHLGAESAGTFDALRR